MTKIDFQAQEALNDLMVARSELAEFKVKFELKKQLEYEIETRGRVAKITSLVQEAYAAGAPKSQIGKYYGTKDAKTITDLINSGTPEALDVNPPVGTWDGETLTLELENTPAITDFPVTGTFKFVQEDGQWVEALGEVMNTTTDALARMLNLENNSVRTALDKALAEA